MSSKQEKCGSTASNDSEKMSKSALHGQNSTGNSWYDESLDTLHLCASSLDGCFSRSQRFHAHDRSHPRSAEIYDQVNEMSTKLKEHGHEYDSAWVTRPLNNNESVESMLCGHSEKLAIAFNLMQRPQPTFIQITKNLRVCGDCRECQTNAWRR